MAKVSGGSAKRPAAKKVAKKVAVPKRPATRAATPTAPRRAPTLPSAPNLPRTTGVPQIDLFHAIGTRIAQVTGQGKGRRRK